MLSLGRMKTMVVMLLMLMVAGVGEVTAQVIADVRIVSPSGITMAAFTIAPGETVETRVNLGGVYIVQTADSQYNKKITVR